MANGFMNITDELERLDKLHKQGTLTDDEFAQAKRKILSQPDEPISADQGRSLGEAANRYLSMQMVMSTAGFIIFLFIFFWLILPLIGHIHHRP